MSGTSSGSGQGSPQRPNEILSLLHYVLAYDVSIGAHGLPVQRRTQPLPREVVIAAIKALRERTFADEARPTTVDHHPV
jgi:hypothetical protein